MRFSKVILACLMAVLAFGMLFTGCAKKEAAPSKVTLNIMGYGDNANAEGLTFKRICEEFMAENPDIVLNYEMLYDEAYHQKVVARLAAGDVPDVAYMGADARWGASWQEANQQIDNTPYYPSNIDVSLVPDFFGNGNRPYLPLGGSNYCTVVGVNTELLAKIGGKIPETYEDLVALAKLCKSNGIECISTHGADGWVWGSCVMSGIIPRTTGDLKWIEKAVNKQVKFTDEGFVAALDVLAQWVKDGVISKDAILIDNGTGLSNFVNGKCLMYIDGQWGFGEQNLGDLSKKVKLISIPPVPGEKACAGSLAGAWQVGYGITKAGASDPAKLEAAKKWIAYFFSETETIQRLADGAISAPILKNFTLPDGMDPCIAEKATLGKYPSCYVIDSYLSGTPNDVLNAGMQNIVAGKTTAKELAAAVQRAFDEQ
ncbi:MAG: carbohydrate ABC transporter substrate-binding protein [Spirochaetaceae bacterium]|nr:carbohydrate ABC transporter substrate-binding protein [Spirochaetaceae bacterium]MBR3814527.1 carbohydrate ABC transporter substrate-binding protein [Spirochaetaceae bacterium]MDD6486902.1 ABC transporter substrate-binding protein [Spirochaetales bacterium]